jgi:hypothetical protein
MAAPLTFRHQNQGGVEILLDNIAVEIRRSTQSGARRWLRFNSLLSFDSS